jgi:predicted nucleotide-binding protein (sugar kinase/HSP70/actin superfamily)
MEEAAMRVTYAHMGYMNAPVRHMLESLDIEVVETPPVSKRTVELGARHSPEGVCLPYKISMGNLLEGLESGADTVVTMCGAGKCRFGFYGTVQKMSFAQGREIAFHTLDTERLLADLYRFLRQVAPEAGRLATARNIALAVKKLRALDALSDAKNFYAPRADNPQQVIDICDYGTGEIAGGNDFAEVNYCREIVTGTMRSHCRADAPQPPKVALVGEFYVLLEPYVNRWIDNALVRQGVEVKRFVHTGGWAYAKTLLQFLGFFNEEREYMAHAKPYLNHHVGGDGLKSVGTALWSARNGYDGIIHIFPFGCMPEIVAQYALKNVAADYGLPLLTLSIDEHASDVGLATRLEAFVDCIKRKKEGSRL